MLFCGTYFVYQLVVLSGHSSFSDDLRFQGELRRRKISDMSKSLKKCLQLMLCDPQALRATAESS